jgi:hypothetical protein
MIALLESVLYTVRTANRISGGEQAVEFFSED